MFLRTRSVKLSVTDDRIGRFAAVIFIRTRRSMVVNHAPATVHQLKSVGGDNRGPAVIIAGRAEVFVKYVNGNQRILCSVDTGKFELHPQSPFENFSPAFFYGFVTLCAVAHRVNALDKVTFGPDSHHGSEVCVGERFVEGLFGIFRCREHGFGHYSRYGTSLPM